jgi:hypothetical protein
MKLRDRVLDRLAEMVAGDDPLFPYRSGSGLARFFHGCGFDFVHDGSTRKWWTKERLEELNNGICPTPDLPSNSLLRVISEMFDPIDFDEYLKERDAALNALNKVLATQGLQAYLDGLNGCRVRNTGAKVDSANLAQVPRPLSQAEILQRKKLSKFLDSASEDEFIETVLVPFFQGLGFHRVSATGHYDRTLEFGKDLWMKYQLPTGHWLYFCAQVKRDKIDASSAPGGNNCVSTVLKQAQMAIGHPIFDPDENRKVLLDHLFIISAANITKAAKDWLGTNLDMSQRRHIIFMDRDEFLNHAARILKSLEIADADEAKPEPPF